ncbi:hypothetical protein K493DRAFT_72432 [Basidiobolus meristosporus CBS 931.73]|uniref:HECT-type E3 ubiquitin transferase n=1 Tax=Basidiobolus meristosporus CBS 931.73 TaxID=1314790 RepID=A0A1Y1XTF8_9FUNG|nr:hypothetical protein K493DRAFT_72432 [Basidiobolus meristosporus CBS 931.73]|eukprot:ORX89041.1 hypothetical protein K493DRAFT_72432 [Basidiobolus meristosporus CBS 931.73]
MFSFEGDFKAKRNINLGGSRQQQDKKDLLKKAQLERKKREQSRKRERSAILIQSFYRGRKRAQSLRSDLRQQWNAKFDDAKIADLTSSRLFQFLRELVLFYRPMHDEIRLVALALVLSNPQPKLPEGHYNFAFSSLAIGEDVYIHTLRKACDILLRAFVRTGDSYLLRCLLFLTEESSYRQINQASDQSKQTVMKILGYLIRKGMYQHLSDYLTQLPEHSTEADVSKLILRVFQYAGPHEEMYDVAVATNHP